MNQYTRIWANNNPVADGYTTFANIHLAYTMFLVDKKEKPIGGFIYPILASIEKADLLHDVRMVLGKELNGMPFEDFIRKYRNKLATHGDLSPNSLPQQVREGVLAQEPDPHGLDLMYELREAVEALRIHLWRELNAASS